MEVWIVIDAVSGTYFGCFQSKAIAKAAVDLTFSAVPGGQWQEFEQHDYYKSGNGAEVHVKSDTCFDHAEHL